jgi:hypothetical protein
MHFRELENFSLQDVVHFHDELNQALFDGDHLNPEVREQLLIIANDFMEHLGLPDIHVKDITLSGSNAAYSYTRLSDIDLHLLVDISQFENDDVYRELFNAKKTVYNEEHDIIIKGFEVELYVQDSNQPVISLGEYSVLNDKWIKLPRKRKADFDQIATKEKYRKIFKLAQYALKTRNPEKITRVIKTLKKYRQVGLDKAGEFSPENLAFKILRSKGTIKQLYEKLKELHDEQLSLAEVNQPDITPDIQQEWQMYECSGYIPSPAEKDDPRWKMALSVDVNPYSMQDNAKRLGSKIKRNGRPPLLRP